MCIRSCRIIREGSSLACLGQLPVEGRYVPSVSHGSPTVSRAAGSLVSSSRPIRDAGRPGTTQLWATGSYTDPVSGDALALIEHFDGATWSIDSTLVPLSHTALSGVSGRQSGATDLHRPHEWSIFSPASRMVGVITSCCREGDACPEEWSPSEKSMGIVSFRKNEKSALRLRSTASTGDGERLSPLERRIPPAYYHVFVKRL